MVQIAPHNDGIGLLSLKNACIKKILLNLFLSILGERGSMLTSYMVPSLLSYCHFYRRLRYFDDYLERVNVPPHRNSTREE